MATIASLFGRHTPFAELQQHMRTVVDCVQHLPLMLQAIVDEDADRAAGRKSCTGRPSRRVETFM